jgi:S-phase kinase-associated protein 1
MAEGDKIKLQSKEGDLFDISPEAARLSKLLATMQDDGMDGESIPLPNVTKDTLAKVVSYMEYHVANPPGEIYRPIRSGNLADSNVCDWDCTFLDVEQDVLFELILAANYLDIKPLLDLTCAQVAAMIKGKTPEELRKQFKITSDFTPEEEEQVRQEKWSM